MTNTQRRNEVQIDVNSDLRFPFRRAHGEDWELLLEVDKNGVIPVTLSPIILEPEWDPWSRDGFALPESRVVGIKLEMSVNRYIIQRVEPDGPLEECGCSGPRIGSEGRPVCRREPMHQGPHKPRSDDGWGAITW